MYIYIFKYNCIYKVYIIYARFCLGSVVLQRGDSNYHYFFTINYYTTSLVIGHH